MPWCRHRGQRTTSVELVLSFHLYVGFRDWAQVDRVTWKFTYPLWWFECLVPS